MERVAKSSLQNQVPTTVPVDTSVQPNRYLIPGLLAINKGDILSIVRVAYAAEVSQIVEVGVAVPVTVVAGQKYQIRLGDTDNTNYGYNNSMTPYSYIAPTTLQNVATDAYNMYAFIAKNINANSAAFANAYARITASYVISSGTASVGDIVTESASGATGIVLTVNSATLLTIGVISGTFTGAYGTLDTTSGSGDLVSTTATRTIVVGLGLTIIDTVGYFTRTAGGSFARKGQNAVIVGGPTGGFIPANIVITTAAVYPYGGGAYLAANMVPHKQVTDDNLSAGIWEFPTDNAVVTSNTYYSYTIVDKNRTQINSGLGQLTPLDTRTQVLWVAYEATNFSAFNTDILALT